MGTDDNGYELAVCHQLGKAAKLRTGTRFSTDSPPVLGITYASILGIPMRIPMLDIVPSARQVIASRASIHPGPACFKTKYKPGVGRGMLEG